MTRHELEEIERSTMAGLKDFQRATVERVAELFRSGQNRVLVADEVGLGKTLIARGTIIKTALMRMGEPEDGGIFRVAYICSNGSIASQNIEKLRVSDSARVEQTGDARLSMLHLKLAEQEGDPGLREAYIQLIPLTPGTSFDMSSGCGTVEERALMGAVLERMPELEDLQSPLIRFLVAWAPKSWAEQSRVYRGRVEEAERRTEGKYPASVMERIRLYDRESGILDSLRQHLKAHPKGGTPDREGTRILGQLRTMFARIGADMLNPDLVIMDEFQRFKSLLSETEESDAGILARKFLGGSGTRILLLSATPYRLYTTLEEMDQSGEEGGAGGDEHYSEFLQVMDFLFSGHSEQFRQIWRGYSAELRELKGDGTSILQMKSRAEDAMYAAVCRTERISVMDSGDCIDDSSVKKALAVTEKDIQSYLEAGRLMKDCGMTASVPADYVKSSPFLLSFMNDYRLKKDIEKYFREHPDEVEKADRKLLWVSRHQVDRYSPLPESNARLKCLIDAAFQGGGELLLWVPPSLPYYQLQGAYRGSGNFSKILVFSSWEMVPRMIGTLISCEAERRTVGVLAEQAENEKSRSYTSTRRYPYPRLRFRLREGEPASMNLFTLLYPSRTLAEMYRPAASMNLGQSLEEIQRDIRAALQERLKALEKYQKRTSGAEDSRWYTLAPMLMDGMEYVQTWLDAMEGAGEEEEEEQEESSGGRQEKAYPKHLERLRELMALGGELELGRKPEDLVTVLTDMVLGSPAVCIFRSTGDAARASALARVFLGCFNTTEATAVVALASERFYAKKTDDTSHWQDVLRYCRDGCFQAMFDEYLHIVRDSTGFSGSGMESSEARDARVHSIMMNSLRVHTASYLVDTYPAFRRRVQGESDEANEEKKLRMRAHYAIGLMTKSVGDRKQDVHRSESIRAAFNSPLRPFVLASTSIGQEGLDFHCYCRRVMHWNLPSNPVDLEQREGRVNRYKCLAIRQNVAAKYGSIPFTEGDLWQQMFQAAEAEKKPGQPDLIPCWCFGENQQVPIERIVPMYPMSRDGSSYERLIRILSLYRLTLGQARQEELLEYLFQECENPEELKKLFINLSPFSRTQKAAEDGDQHKT